MAKMMHFSGTTELSWIDAMPNKEFAAKFGDAFALKYDSFHKFVGSADPYNRFAKQVMLPVTRSVKFKSNPSLHKCDARCMNAKGHSCECSCHGKNHGAGRSMA